MSESQEQTKHYMSWDDKIKSVERVMHILDQIDVKDGDRERELVDVLELTTKLLLPNHHVKLSFNSF